MNDVYSECPQFCDNHFLLRSVTVDDANDLLAIYSNKNAVPFFNSDNCHGDNFYYPTIERMISAIHFWLSSYTNRYFVRWAIVDVAKPKKSVIGTIELFHRDATDFFTNTGLLRIDLDPCYEKAVNIEHILHLILPEAFTLFDCSMIATKAIPEAIERRIALTNKGFTETEQKLIGYDNTSYGDYFFLKNAE